MSDHKATNPKDRAATARLDLSLFPMTALAYGALGMTEGDCKYGGYNYRVGGVLCSVYIAACGRHLAKYYNGEWADKKTGVPHLASALACVAIIIDAHECGALRDDRPPRVDMAELLDKFELQVKFIQQLFPNGPSRYTEAQYGKKKITPPRKTLRSLSEYISTPKARKRKRRNASKRFILR